MTYAPAPLKAAQTYLKERTGLPWVSLGIVGDENHIGGYHQGKPNVPVSDYSRDESARDEKGLTGAASALDIGDFARLRELSRWIVEQCKAGAADTKDIREVIYSPDGRTVKRWDRLGVRDSGDSSHLKHTHISYHRDSENRDKTGLFRRFFEDASTQIDGGIMLPKFGDEGEEVRYWQRMLAAVGETFPKYGMDGKYGNEMTAAVVSWFGKQGGSSFDGRRITSWIAMRLQQQVFRGAKGDRGPAGPAGPAGKDGVVRLPMNVKISGAITGE